MTADDRPRAGHRPAEGRWPRAVAAVVAILLVASSPGPGGAVAAEPLRLRVGLPAPAVAFLSLYLVAEQTGRTEGLDLELVTFRGAAGLAPAVVSDSIDVGLASLNTVIRLIEAGQDVKVFYGGLSHADATWFGGPSIRSWEDLRGRTMAVPTFGGYVDLLTHRALKARGLTLGQDVHVARMTSASSLSALVAGRIDAALLPLPFAWEAEARGLKRLGSEVEEIGTTWPKNLFFAKARVLATQGGAVRALLRAHVRALRLVKADPVLFADLLQRHVGYPSTATARAYQGVVAGLSERGEIPPESLKVFWQILAEAGEQASRWPDARYLDPRYVDGFESWAPRH